MKLRNKKTGEIIDLAKRGLLKSDNYNHIIVYPEGTLKYYAYDSLTELNAEWEDYAPAGPLIKDEKIRKAVRAWAEAFDVEKIYYDAKMLRLHDNKCKTVIGIKYPILGVWDRKEPYTIDELCGEED